MLTLDQVKEWLRMDQDSEDSLLSSLITVSETFVVNATHPNADKTSELFLLAQRFLISHWYENRDLIGSNQNLPFHLAAILQQIAFTTEDPIV